MEQLLYNWAEGIGPIAKKSVQKEPFNQQITSVLAVAPIGPTVSDQFAEQFFSVSFSHHYELLVKTASLEERQFYIARITTEFWSLETLKHHLKNKLFKSKGILPNNFATAISNEKRREKALQSFKDEYLLDFINIEDPDEEEVERGGEGSGVLTEWKS